ncbi:LSm family protein [Spiroplasma chrysopicola]|uniref:Ribosome maturation factor RimP n=1 Tax=Spiroplasma chrysopicola DF-1 TaxID=1276227 RepID=R4UGT9_9MOLU|nr:ribosome maturation factor RimP [Spiroplasma chrysopicola]AGM25365.1 ribosome maturation factor RimP [Spiroplasma chrysopicola DF-1]
MDELLKHQSVIKAAMEEYLQQNNLMLFSLNSLVEFDTNILQVLVEDQAAVIDLDRLVKISEDINQIIDHLDLIQTEYVVEVSTPGAERPLRNFEELAGRLNEEVLVEFITNVDKLPLITGQLVAVDLPTQTLTIKYFKKGQPKKLSFRYDNVKFARCAVKF